MLLSIDIFQNYRYHNCKDHDGTYVETFSNSNAKIMSLVFKSCIIAYSIINIKRGVIRVAAKVCPSDIVRKIFPMADFFHL